jgi:acid stress chaperone HdeB
MEVIVKLRLLLTGALFLFAQISTMQAQETLDLSKITCDQLAGEKLAASSNDVALWLSGYYNGERHNTIVEPQAIKKHVDQVNLYCLNHREMTVMDAVKTVLDFDK